MAATSSLTIRAIVVSILLSSASAASATPTSFWELIAHYLSTVAGSASGALSPAQEAVQFKYEYDYWIGQPDLFQPDPIFPYFPDPVTPGGVGGLFTPDVRPVPGNPNLAPLPVELKFFRLGPPATPAVPELVPTSVRYFMIPDPAQLVIPGGATGNDISAIIRPQLVLVGSSSNYAANFATTVQLSGYEPILLAFQYDAAGNEITGENAIAVMPTVQVPEPAAWTMFIVGFGLIGHALRRGTRRPAVA